MTTLYAESSAIMRWLLGTPDAPALQAVLRAADQVVTSAITSAEVGRTLRRLAATDAIVSEARDGAWLRFCAVAAHWNIYTVTDRVLERTVEPFPREPVRTLDAIHLATAARYSLEVGPVTMFSVDTRLRENAIGLGMGVAPDGA